jgi:hypothetical protein
MSDPAPRVLAVAAPGVPTASDTLRGIGFVVVAYFRPGRCPLDSRQGGSPLAGFRAAP